MLKEEYVARSLSRGTNKPFETFVINAIYSKLNNPNLELVTQQHVITKDKETKYIDLYFPQIKVAIEVDESYHDSETQKMKDWAREEDIKKAVLESTIVDLNGKIEFIRISISNSRDLGGIFAKIDEIVNEIKCIIKKQDNPLVWHFSEEERLNEVKKRGYLQRGDSFAYMNDIGRLFGISRNGNGCGRCTIKISEETMVWSPTLSLEGSNKDGWENTISDDLVFIYERGVCGKEKTEEGFIWHKKHNIKRYTFLKYKDSLGNSRRRFLGIYIADSFDKEKKTEVWKLIKEEVAL